MNSALQTYSRDLQSGLSRTYQSLPVLQLNYDSPIDQIFTALDPIKTYNDLLEYWATMFLIGCETNGPAIPILNAQNFVLGLTYALYGVTVRGDQNLRDLCAPSVDQLLINELTEDLQNQAFDTLLTAIKPVFDYKHLFPSHEFICFKQGNIIINSLWTEIKNFSENEVPDDSILDACKKLSEAHKLGLYTKDLAYTLSEFVLSYINNLKLDQVGQPGYNYQETKINNSDELITCLEEINEDQDVKQEIENYKILLNNAKNNKPVVVSGLVNPPDNHLEHLNDPGIYILDRNLVTRAPRAKYSVPKGNIQTSIYDGQLNGSHVCIKVYETDAYNKHKLSSANTEIKIYEALSRVADNSNCFLRYYGTYFEENSLCMVMEYYGSSLMDAIKSLRDSNFQLLEDQFINITYKLLSSFKLMKDMNILHNDIKPHNLLVDQNWNIKIIDFGISVTQIQGLILSQSQVFPIQGTEGYLSPEKKLALQNNQSEAKYNLEKSDVYSLGLTFYQLLTFKNIENLTNQDLINGINSVANYSKEIKTLLCSMLDQNPQTRPNFAQALGLMTQVPKTQTFIRK